MKLKILYAVLLLGAISQLNGSYYGSYYWNRINFLNRYRSQCAKALCYGNNNLWNNCMTLNQFNIKNDVYYKRDCYAIGGIPNINTDKGLLYRQCNPYKSKYFSKSERKYFNISVCGSWDSQDRKLLRDVQFVY
jgi:hypothetical protein